MTRNANNGKRDSEGSSDRPGAPWHQFPDVWALLNATAKGIWGAAKADPYPGESGWTDAQIGEVNQLLDAFRTVYAYVARGLPDEQFGEASQAAEIIESILRDRGMLPEHRLSLSGDKAQWTWGTTFVGTAGPLNRIEQQITDLARGLHEAGPSTIYVCSYCGRIGPAQRTRKRYCNSTCRTAATRMRQRRAARQRERG